MEVSTYVNFFDFSSLFCVLYYCFHSIRSQRNRGKMKKQNKTKPKPHHFYFYKNDCCCCLVAKSCPSSATPWTEPLCPWNFSGKNTGVGCCFLL